MQKILRKRVARDLKENLLRYLALALLIILGMYLIVSLVGAADTIILGVEKKAEENHVEDGQFSVFVPLTEKEKNKLTEKGITLEEMFYLDFEQQDESVLRCFKNREFINQIEVDEGRLAETEEEAVLEKRYCQEHQISIGDSIAMGEHSFEVVGIGTVPDYDAMYRNLSDGSVDSKQFGLVFVSESAYEQMKKSKESMKSEEYTYAYRLNKAMTDEELKEKLKKLAFTPKEVEDSYFQEYWEETAGKVEEMEDGIGQLLEGTRELQKALEGLSSYNGNLQKGAAEILDSYLKEANKGFSAYGLTQELTEENFEEVLGTMKEESDNGILRLTAGSTLESLKELKRYKDGVTDYTDGVKQSAAGAAELSEGMKELKEGTTELLEGSLDGAVSNLTRFLKAADNPRIHASANDQVINKTAGLIAGVIVMVLFTYVISVFVIHGIERESSVIGALYALGVRKGELILHYLMLPVLVTFLAGVAGTVTGFSKWGVNVQMQDCYNYFSIPALETVYAPYLLIYGLVMPPVAAAVVNGMVIRKKLSQPALKLMRSEQKNRKINKLNLGNLGFVGRFRIRQMLRELRTSFTVVFGMFISLLILMLGVDCYVMCRHISAESKEDTKYEYMYTYKYPQEQVPEGGEACFAKSLKKELYGYNLDITLLGIEKDNPYFDAEVSKGKNKVIISSAMAQRYHLKSGDKLVVSDEEEDMDYAFTVEGVTQFSTGFYVFMDIQGMRELLGQSEDYYNVVFADHALDIPSGRLYATVTRAEISKSSDVFVDLMMPMIYMMSAVSILIFCIVMYLMMKVMIDRSAFNISLIKIFGYRIGEIRKLYLNGNFYVIAVGAAICIPLSKKLMDAMYPALISNVVCAMNLTFSWQLYAGMYAGILGLYFIINQLLVRRLKKLVPADVLKNRE